KKRVSGEHRSRPRGLSQISHRNAHALNRVTGSGEKIEPALPELEGIAILDGSVRERCVGAIAQIDARSSALGKLMMAGDKIGVQMRFNDVLDLQVLFPGEVKIDVDIALRIDYCCNAFRSHQIGSVRQTA